MKFEYNDASHPLRVRGLKPACLAVPGILPVVAPFTGAWIETSKKLALSVELIQSHPLRVRPSSFCHALIHCFPADFIARFPSFPERPVPFFTSPPAKQ